METDKGGELNSKLGKLGNGRTPLLSPIKGVLIGILLSLILWVVIALILIRVFMFHG
jgi:hypothetical protein